MAAWIIMTITRIMHVTRKNIICWIMRVVFGTRMKLHYIKVVNTEPHSTRKSQEAREKRINIFLNSGFAGLIFITTIIIVIVSSPPSSSSSKLNRFIFITKNESTYQVLVSVPPYYHTQYGSKNQLQVKISEVK